jgi:hypothetical protein
MSSLALWPAHLLFGNSRPLIISAPHPHATKAYGQLLGRNFSPLDTLLLLRTVRSSIIAFRISDQLHNRSPAASPRCSVQNAPQLPPSYARFDQDGFEVAIVVTNPIETFAEFSKGFSQARRFRILQSRQENTSPTRSHIATRDSRRQRRTRWRGRAQVIDAVCADSCALRTCAPKAVTPDDRARGRSIVTM